MKILYIGSEAAPYAATGGLGDVLGSLPEAVANADKENDVRVAIPLYSQISNEYRAKMKKVCEFTVQLAWRNLYCGVYKLKKGRVTYYFIDNEYYFKRSKLYGEYDDGERFAYFSHAVIDMLEKIDFVPDVINANDWQTADAVIYLKLSGKYPGVKTVYTIHNIEYQGKYDLYILGDIFAIREDQKSVVEYEGCINLTKGAIVTCDKLTTVSAKYAEEIRTPFFAHGLAPVINSVSDKVSGIVNGIDYKVYDPLHDGAIEANFSAARVSNKKLCKAALQREASLDVSDDTPLVAMITRLASHKGLDLVTRVIDEAVESGIQFVVLGTGEAEYEQFFRELEERHRGKVRAFIEFNKAMAKKIYAGADIFLMPSKSEPCGLAQMIASRYGTVPIVRETGGLADTIAPFNPETGEGNGITFFSYNAHDMLYAIKRAISLYNDKNAWKTLRKNAMTKDFSWSASARLYLEMYKEL